MAKSQKGFINSLRNIFGIKPQKSSDSKNIEVPQPAKKQPDRGEKSPIGVKMADEMQKLYQTWLADTYENSDTLKNRMERYSSLEYAYYNNTLVSLTVELYADETPQTDSQKEVLQVDAKDKKVKKYINEFFEKVGVTPSFIRNIAWNLALYGDSFAILSSNKEEGITEIIPVDVYNVKERFEFKASEVKKKQGQKKFGAFMKNDSRLTALSKLLDQDTDDYAEMFRSYLFGFDLGKGLYLPPWNMLHFRSFTTQSEFWPFGRPLLINSLAPFRQLQAAKNLMALARATRFPIKKFEVDVGDEVDPATQWERVQEAAEEYNNLGNEVSGQEEFAANSSIWVPKDLISLEQLESKIDLDEIADVEMLRDDLIMGTRVPKGYLIVDKSSFGTSGQSLLRQHKPFARAVYQLQSAILEELTQMVRIQFAMTGDFDYNTDFEISMNYPMVEESKDRVQTKNDTLRLANDMVDNLGQAMGLDRGEALPPDVVKKIFSKLSFLDDEDVDEWVDATVEMQNQNAEEDEGGGGMMASYTNRAAKLVESYSDSEFDQLINESYYQARKNLKEGVLANNHFYTSSNIDRKQKATLDAIEKGDGKKLKE